MAVVAAKKERLEMILRSIEAPLGEGMAAKLEALVVALPEK